MSDNDTIFKDVLVPNWRLVRINPKPDRRKGGRDYFIITNFAEIVKKKLDAYLVIKTKSDDEYDEEDEHDELYKHYKHYNRDHPQIVFGKWGALGIMRPPRMKDFWEIIKDDENFFVWNPATSNWDKSSSFRNSIAPTFLKHNKTPTIDDMNSAEDAFDSMKEQFGEYLKKQQEILDDQKGGKKSKKSKRTKARKPVKKQRKTRKHKK